MDCSLPGSSIHGIFQARALEWVAISFSGIFSHFFAILKNFSFERGICKGAPPGDLETQTPSPSLSRAGSALHCQPGLVTSAQKVKVGPGEIKG